MPMTWHAETHAAAFTQNARTSRAQRDAFIYKTASLSPFCFATAGRLPLATTQATRNVLSSFISPGEGTERVGPLAYTLLFSAFHDQLMLSTAANPLLWNNTRSACAVMKPYGICIIPTHNRSARLHAAATPSQTTTT